MKTNAEIRRENLRILSREYGSVRAFAEIIEKNESQVSQWINGSINSGTGRPRTMRDITARMIEEKCDKPKGWLDVDQNVESRFPTQAITSQVISVSTWPFENVSETAYKRLTLEGRLWVQAKMDAAITEAEAKFGSSTIPTPE